MNVAGKLGAAGASLVGWGLLLAQDAHDAVHASHGFGIESAAAWMQVLVPLGSFLLSTAALWLLFKGDSRYVKKSECAALHVIANNTAGRIEAALEKSSKKDEEERAKLHERIDGVLEKVGEVKADLSGLRGEMRAKEGRR